jgi:ABC-type dipeptide/oligopeptide/nickel transport system permease subunit
VAPEGRAAAGVAAAGLGAAAGEAAPPAARRRWRRLARRPPALAGCVLVACFTALALAAPWLAPADPIRTDWGQIRKPPSAAHPLGTDDLGRDVLARVIWGTRISMRAGVLSILLAMAAGVPAGLVSGYYRGAVDQVVMRVTDAWLAFPFLVLAIGLVTILGPSLTNATIAIGVGATPTFVRLTRGLVLAAREEDYVEAARALGGGDGRLMARHVLPNITSAILVQATVSIPAAIIGEAVLSFLGLGVQPPEPSWGTMLNAAQQFLETAPWMAIWPGLAIFLLTLAFNLAGDGVRDVLDPRDA